MIDLNIKIGGAAGQGMQTVGFLLGKIFVRGGYHAFAVQDNMSRIRGGHNFFQVRVKNEPVMAMTSGVHFLVALDKESIEAHMSELVSDGLVIYDGESLNFSSDEDRFLNVPLEKLATERGGKKIYFNSVSLGFILGLLDFGQDIMSELFRESFAKSEEVAEGNIKAARAGYEYARHNFAERWKLTIQPEKGPRMMFLNGNDAVCLGAVASGCKFMSAYPMSPSTAIITYLAGKADQVGMVTEQAEDEIAAINLALGASAAGVRSMVATSGGGLALMVETLSLLGASEVPLVIVDCQRPGPATGLPTRTEQADLLFVIHSGHGEFPRAVLAPGNPEQAFHTTIKAFNLAERFQIPAFILSDQYLCDSYFTCEPFDISNIPFETSLLGDELSKMEDYKRYRFTDSGISPRAYPMQSKHLVVTDGHEHDESGHITEDAQIRTRMMEKRLKKMDGILGQFAGPEPEGPENSSTIICGWGSTLGVLREAVAALKEDGSSSRLLHFSELWPFPTAKTMEELINTPRLVVVESNATGQLAQLIRQRTGRQEMEHILKYDGRPFTVEGLVSELRKVVID